MAEIEKEREKARTVDATYSFWPSTAILMGGRTENEAFSLSLAMRVASARSHPEAATILVHARRIGKGNSRFKRLVDRLVRLNIRAGWKRRVADERRYDHRRLEME